MQAELSKALLQIEVLQASLVAVEAERDAARERVKHCETRMMRYAMKLAEMQAERDAALKRAAEARETAENYAGHCNKACKHLEAVEAERDAARAGEARAVEALKAVIAGAYPHEEEIWTMEGAVLRHVHRVLDQYEPTLDNQPTALAWLAQQRREAAAGALKEFADDAVCMEKLITCNIFDLRSALRTRAAALRAGEVGND